MHVGAFRQPHTRSCGCVFECADAVDPWPARVHDDACVDAELGAVDAVANLDSGDLAVELSKRDHVDVVREDGARICCRVRNHQRDPAVVHLVVVVQTAAAQPFGAQSRNHRGRFARGEQLSRSVVEPRQRGVDEHARADLHAPVRTTLIERNQKRHRLHEVRGELVAERAPLGVVFIHQPDVAHGQVAQAAVYQLGGSTRGRARKIAGVDHSDPKARPRSMPGRRQPDDAAADDDDVESAAFEGFAGDPPPISEHGGHGRYRRHGRHRHRCHLSTLPRLCFRSCLTPSSRFRVRDVGCRS